VIVDINHYIAFVESELTPRRFEHSLGVMNVMRELAVIYELDETTALLCGILHDVAKEFTLERQLEVAGKNNIQLLTEHDRHPLFLHGAVGACYIADELGIANPAILDAIRHHSYSGNGNVLSPLFCWCLRFADILEPSRDWEDIKEQLKPAAYSGNMQHGAHLMMQWAISFHESTSIPVHPNMRRVFQELCVLQSKKDACDINKLPV
jgi:predicted HD superfamily hydrolase involved in NAD metabolism